MRKHVGNVQFIQKMNRLKVLNYIRQNPTVARPQIAEATGLSLSSITNIVTYLLNANLVTEIGLEEVDRVGRKGILLRFNKTAYELICVHIGDEDAEIARTDLEGNILEKKTCRIEKRDTEQLTTVIKNACNEMKNSGAEILAVGVDISALVLSDGEYILSSSLKWNPVNLKAEIKKATKLPVFVENTSYTKAVYQFKCQNENAEQKLVFVDLDGGYGVVQFYKGTLNHSILGEIGHTTVEKDGDECFCGNHGCLEVMCSSDRAVSVYNKSSENKIESFDELCNLVEAGDSNAIKAASECGEYIGIGLANIVNIFNPEAIIVNGAEYLKCDLIMNKAEETMRKRSYNVISANLPIEKVSIDFPSLIKGIAFNLCDNIFDIDCKYNIIE